MNITLNGHATEVEADTLSEIVRTVTSRRTGVAAAVGGQVVPRSEWDTTVVHDGDVIEVVAAVQGG